MSDFDIRLKIPTLCVHQPLDSVAKLNYDYRNRLINGDFSVWQRGDSIGISPDGYTADRWYATLAGSVYKGVFATGESELMGNDQFYLHAVPSAFGSIVIEQPIEDVWTLAGKEVTLTFWAKAATGTALSVAAVQDFGTATLPIVPASPVTTTIGSATLSTAWQKITLHGTIPTIAGLVVGTNNDHNLSLQFTISASSLDLAHVQFEQGPLATDFEKRLPGEELRLARRYYERFSYAGAMRPPIIGQCTSSALADCMLLYTPKRIIPAITIPSGIQIIDSTSIVALAGTWATNLATTDSATVRFTVAAGAGLNTGNVAFSWTNGGTAIEIDAEY